MGSSKNASKGKHDLGEKSSPVAKKTKMERQLEDVDNLLGNPLSLLYRDGTPIKSILKHDLAVGVLNAMPDGNRIAEADANQLNSAVSQFKEDGRGGCHEEQWVAEAGTAGTMRQMGVFAEMQEAKFAREWATESRELSENDDDRDKKDKKGKKRAKSCNSKDLDKLEEDDQDDGGAGGGKTRGQGFDNFSKYDNHSSNVSNAKANSFHASKQGDTQQEANVDTVSVKYAQAELERFRNPSNDVKILKIGNFDVRFPPKSQRKLILWVHEKGTAFSAQPCALPWQQSTSSGNDNWTSYPSQAQILQEEFDFVNELKGVDEEFRQANPLPLWFGIGFIDNPYSTYPEVSHQPITVATHHPCSPIRRSSAPRQTSRRQV